MPAPLPPRWWRQSANTRLGSEADRAELSGVGGDYRDVPVRTGEIGGSSYVEATGAPSGETNFAK